MKLGIVGFGAQAQGNLVPCCLTMPEIEIAAISDINPQRRHEAMQKLRVGAAFADPHTMIDQCDIDALIVACYPTSHFEIACHALNSGIPVFVEKPPAPSSGHLEKMTELARTRRLTTGVGMNFRFANVTQRLKDLSEGQINLITLRHFCNKPTTPFWDLTCLLKSFLYSQTIHGLDFLIDLCGPVADVSVVGKTTDTLILMTIVLTFENGATASLITSNTCPHFIFDFDVIAMESRHISSSALWSVDVAEVDKTYAQNEQKRWTDHWAHSPLSSGYERSGYAGQMSEFISAVREGRESTISFASVAPVYQCMDQIMDQMGAVSSALTRKAS